MISQVSGNRGSYRNYKNLEVVVINKCLVVYLDRPERLNAINNGMREELIECLIGAENDASVTGIVITGKGDRAFSSGADLHEVMARTVGSELDRGADIRRDVPRVIETLAKPTIAAINGVCLGGGLEIALACTVRIADSSAVFGFPEINYGLIPGSGGSQRLPRVVGLGWAMQIVTSGARIGAIKAEQIGLVTEVVASEDLLARGIELASSLGQKGSIAFSAARDAVLSSFEIGLDLGINLERRLLALCISTSGELVVSKILKILEKT